MALHERSNIVFYDVEPPEYLSGLQLPDETYPQWMAEALEVPTKEIHVVEVYKGEELPRLGNTDLVIVGGSDYSVCSPEPWHEPLKETVKHAIESDVPVLGICYGFQTGIQAYDGHVTKDHKGAQIGVTDVELTPDGRRHQAFEGLPQKFPVNSAHSDAPVHESLQSPITLFATHPDHPVQAVGFGNNGVGVAWHPELTFKHMLPIEKLQPKDMTDEDIRRRKLAERYGRKVMQNMLSMRRRSS